MTDRVYPSSKPATANGVTNGATVTTTTTAANGAAKPQQLRQPYRPPPQYHRRHRRSNRNFCCCCCFWSILIFLFIALIAAIAGTALYILYRPHRPEFTVTSFKIGKLNLTESADGATSRLVTQFNLTLSAKNPNNHLKFAYESFALAVSASDVQIGNGSIPAFVSDTKNFTSFHSILSASQDLDVESAKSLRSDLKRKNGVPLEMKMDTRVRVTVGDKFKLKKVGIRVTCRDFRGVPPKGKTPSVVSVAKADCKVDLRVKIFRWTF